MEIFETSEVLLSERGSSLHDPTQIIATWTCGVVDLPEWLRVKLVHCMVAEVDRASYLLL